ncbi:MAG: IS4 family transposase [Candidatus Sericytochromatia bacterium]|nr:IS4 family transposase [Candidatus Sericytochromatia bacterium]
MPHPNPLVRNIATLLGDARLLDLARQTGFLVRQRDLQVVPFFWTLVLGMIAQPTDTIAGLQRLYHQLTGVTLASSSFQARFNAGLVAWLRAAFDHVVAATGEERRQLAGPLASFRELLVTDSTVLRLHALLAGKYPGTRTNHSPAQAKLNVLYNVASGRIVTSQVAAGTRSETRLFTPGAWVKGALLLFDLGYFKLQTFWRIDFHEGYFISRLKDGCNPTIKAIHSTHRGRAIDVVGKKLKDVLGALHRQTLDAQVAYTISRKGLPGRPRSDRKTEVLSLRLVAHLNPETGRYHLYVTNIPPEMLTAQGVADAYRLRWQVELLFKELRSIGGLDAWPNRKEAVVLAGIYATLLGMAVNRRLLLAIRERLEADPTKQARTIGPMRWTNVFAAHAGLFLGLILGTVKQTHQQARSFVTMLLREAVDPKRAKPRQGVICAC